MATSNLPEQLKKLEIPGRVTLMEGNGDLPKLEITAKGSQGEVYLQGAHITHFQKTHEDPLLFLSQFSRFAPGQPIRGGIPVIFPWFGPREGEPMHGFARLEQWELRGTSVEANDSVQLRFVLPDCAAAGSFPPFTFEYVVSFSDTLTLETSVTNTSLDTDFGFEVCLHTYLALASVADATITGLRGVRYLDKVHNFAEKVEGTDPIKIASEVDRIYLNTSSAVEVHDPGKKRRIRIETSGSASTVLWNPWIAKAQQMPDFGNDEYQRMVCVESGNVASNKITLAPGRSARMRVTLSSRPHS